jgi:alpha-L-fucosidase
VHPNIPVRVSCEFATATNAERKRIEWMEKFGEWKHALQVSNWQPGGLVEWEVAVARAGDYHIELTYKGEGRPVWSVSTSEGARIQNQQAASHVYHTYPMGVIRFNKPGKHKVSVSLVDGDPGKSSLEAIRFTPIH